MAGQPIPSDVAGITPDWLTDALRSTGVLERGAVGRIEATPIGDRASYTGEVYRLRIGYDGAPVDAPRSLVAKLLTRDAAKREAGETFRPNEREIRFYRDLARRLDVPTPRCYYAAMNPPAGRYVLLLDDLAPAVVLGQLHGCTREHAEMAVDALARMHRSWASIGEEPPGWLLVAPDARAAGRALIKRLYASAWPAFVVQSGDLLPPAALSTGEALLERLDDVWERLEALPTTLAHGDYRVANMAFGAGRGAGPFAIFDWEDVGMASGMIDLAWFVAGCLDPADRPTWEAGLIALYRAIAVTTSSDDAWRLAMLDRFVQAVLMATRLWQGSDRDRELAAAVTRRFASACADLDLAELIDGSGHSSRALDV